MTVLEPSSETVRLGVSTISEAVVSISTESVSGSSLSEVVFSEIVRSVETGCSISTDVEVPCPNALGISRVEGAVRSVVEVIVTPDVPLDNASLASSIEVTGTE